MDRPDRRYHFRVYPPNYSARPGRHDPQFFMDVTTGGLSLFRDATAGSTAVVAAELVLKRTVLELPAPSTMAWHRLVTAFVKEFISPHIDRGGLYPDAPYGWYVWGSAVVRWRALYVLATA